VTARPARTAARRTVLGAAVAVPSAALLLERRAPASAAATSLPEVRALEREHDATIGFHASRALVRGARALEHRATERAPIHSVFKALAAGAVLRDLDRRGEVLEKLVRYTSADLVDYSPVTEVNLERGMTVRELCDAAIRFSDNAAANLLLRELGGPGAITTFARSLGDCATRLDRWEPDLNEAAPGDPRDTTTPRAVAGSLSRLLVGEALTRPDRATLRDWMLRNTTSDARFRAGLPSGWRLADKTGSGERTYNDAGIAYPPHGRPLVIAAFVRLASPDTAASEAIHAELARIAVRRLG
jgi:beta-lactamase class A